MLRLKTMRLLAIVAALALLAMACAPEEPADTGETETPTETEEPTEPDEPTETEPAEAPEGGLVIGYLLPETGPLAFLGPAQIQAVQMAVSEVNEAGGVFGQDVTLLEGDEAGDPAIASTSVDRLLADGAHAIVGAAASGMSLAVIDQIVGAGVLQCSASNTSATFTTYEDEGLYFRTAPSDVLQGPTLAEVIVGDGHANVVVMARGDDYGQGFADNLSDALEEAGATVAETIIYDPEAATYSSEVEQAAGANPDAIALIAFDEGTQILQDLIEAGVGPGDVGVYGADGIRDSELNEKVDPGDPNVIDGFKGTAPDTGTAEDTAVDPDWRARYDEFSGGEEPIFSAQAYDCTLLTALAAVAAGEPNGQSMADVLVDLTRGDNECGEFTECAELLENGETIAYQFKSGVTEFTDAGEPAGASYEVWEWTDGELLTTDTILISLD